jgi:hypothetical protein
MNSDHECASFGEARTWDQIDWAECEHQVRRMQGRIVKATREGRWNKVKTLQWLLTHSFSGRALAVKRVTENKGKRTPGVDGRTWQTPAAKFKSMGPLRRRGYVGCTTFDIADIYFVMQRLQSSFEDRILGYHAQACCSQFVPISRTRKELAEYPYDPKDPDGIIQRLELVRLRRTEDDRLSLFQVHRSTSELILARAGRPPLSGFI